MNTGNSGFDPRIYWQMLLRRKWIVVGSFVAGTIIGLFLALNAKPRFLVTSTLLLRELDLEFNMGKNAMGPRVTGMDDIDLLKTKILSPPILGELVDKVGLLSDSAVAAEAKQIRASFPRLDLQEVKRNLAIQKLQDRILGIKVHGTNLIEIQAEHEDPELAYTLVSTLISIFIEQTQQTETSGLASGLKYSSEQLEIYKKRLEDAETRLQSLRTGRELKKLTRPQIDDQQAEELRAISLASANQLALEQRVLRDAAAGLAGSDGSVSSFSNPEISRLVSQQTTKLSELVESLRMKDGNQELLYKINKEIKDIDAALQSEVEAAAPASLDAVKRSAWVDSKIATLRIRFLEKKKQAIDYVIANYQETRKASLTSGPLLQMTEERLTDEVARAREMYLLFLKQKEGAEMVQALKDAQSPFLYRLIDPPQRPMASIAMSKRNLLMAGSIVGLMLGIGIIFGMDQLDRSLKKVDDIEVHLQVPVFGLMPKLPRGDFRFVLDSKEAVDVQRIATKLTKQLLRGNKTERTSSNHQAKVIMITSSVMGEGKSTFSSYLAACFAEMLKNTPVLLVDTDLRRGMLHKIFKVDNSYGLGNLLEETEDNQTSAECLQSTQYASLNVLTSGFSTESPVTLLTSGKFGKMIDQLKKYYELIILDTPPVIPVNDALLMSRYADTMLYVVKAGETPREIAKRGMGLVRTTECHLSGVVMNNMQDVLPYYYRHDHYKYEYEHQESAPAPSHNGSNGKDLKVLVPDDHQEPQEKNKESNGKDLKGVVPGNNHDKTEKNNDKSSVDLIEGLQHAE